MLRWLLKTLWLQKASLLASAAGVAGAFVLVLILQAVFAGEARQMVAYARHAPADVWVMQRGVLNMHMANSFVWAWKAKRIAQLPGVRAAIPILYSGALVRMGGRTMVAYAVGLGPDAHRAGPWAMAAGRAIPEPGEIVLPRVFAQLTGVGLGARVELTGKRLEVVGLSEGTYSMANPVVFVAASDLADMMQAEGTVSYILVEAEPGQDAAADDQPAGHAGQRGGQAHPHSGGADRAQLAEQCRIPVERGLGGAEEPVVVGHIAGVRDVARHGEVVAVVG